VDTYYRSGKILQELKQSIANQDCFRASLLLAQYFHSTIQTVSCYEQQLNDWAKQAKAQLDISQADLANLDNLLHFFYVELAFSVDEKQYFAKQYSLLDKVLEYRTGIPITLAIVFRALAEKLGFVSHGVNFPGHFLLSIELANQDLIYLDPSNGKKLSKVDIEQLYFNIIGEIEQEKMPPEALFGANCEEIIVRLLHNLKASYINAQQFPLALTAVNLLVQLCPNDPYERRDRGFLLHQLECSQVAVADYRYFIQHCPTDPASLLLAAQVKQLVAEPPAIFH
jgi:regulator of sirC expression with transglutaminase-like and TPR domain